MNLNDASQHIGDCFSQLILDKFPELHIVMLLQTQENVSVVSNIKEVKMLFEVLIRSMSSCFDESPKSEFTTNCYEFIKTIKPTIVAVDDLIGVVICFLDTTKTATLISSYADIATSLAIICDHLYRNITGEIEYCDFPEVPTSLAIH